MNKGLKYVKIALAWVGVGAIVVAYFFLSGSARKRRDVERGNSRDVDTDIERVGDGIRRVSEGVDRASDSAFRVGESIDRGSDAAGRAIEAAGSGVASLGRANDHLKNLIRRLQGEVKT
jgi:hypothetical protein